MLGKWGPNFAVDLVPFIINNNGINHITITRKDGSGKAMIPNGDGRNTDNSWMMTSIVYGVLPPAVVKEIKVEGKDDASEARFEKISSKL